MPERSLHRLSDPELEAALRGLARSIDWPSALPSRPGDADLAATVRARIEAFPAPTTRRAVPDLAVHLPVWRARPARRALLLALAAVLALAAIAGAVGLGLPGLRLLLGETPTSPPPSPSATIESGAAPAPGAALGLGEPVDATDPVALAALAGFSVGLPADAAVGPPAAAYFDDERGGQVTLIWPTGPDLPATREPGVGLLLGQFKGAVEAGFFTKLIDSGTSLERVRIDGHAGFWISGEPHVLFWDGPDGVIDDSRRWVGDALIWSDGAVTFRLESALGRDAAIRIAESMP